MRFRNYKNTDLTVSEVGFGLWTISTGWWSNFTEGEAAVAGSNKKIASPKLGSSFQDALPTSAKTFRRRISAACASVGALESGFTVEPCPTMRSAVSGFATMASIQRPTACPERKPNGLNAQRPTLNSENSSLTSPFADKN